MGGNSAEHSRNVRFGVICAVIGLLLGLPASYFFQSELPEPLQGLGRYMGGFKDIFSDRWRATVALMTIAILAVGGFLVGLFVAGIVSGLKEARPNPAAKSPRK